MAARGRLCAKLPSFWIECAQGPAVPAWLDVAFALRPVDGLPTLKAVDAHIIDISRHCP